ncbi:MAG: galactokinase, partial [Candidatus Aminicenantales bacterium]
FLATRRQDRRVRVWAEDFQEEHIFSLKDPIASLVPGWGRYIRGIFWVLKQAGKDVGGVDALVKGDIPMESGLSSSAALEVSVLCGLNRIFRLGLSSLEIATLSQKAENAYVGVQCGLMDQFSAVFARRRRALFLDCETLKFQYIPVRLEEAGLTLLVHDTGVRRDLSSSEYNIRRSEAERALEELRRHGWAGFREARPEDLPRIRKKLEGVLFRRARHVISENHRVLEAASALERDDFQRLGELLFLSHESLRDDYEVSCPELDLLYEVARRNPGCLGARLTGAGFGGSGIALVREASVPTLEKELREEASRRGFPEPTLYRVRIGGGCTVQDI